MTGEKNTELAREFNAVHDVIRDFCYRGYRGRQQMDRIGVGISSYDNRLRKQIECMLNETDALTNGKFVHKPMEWQENPLAEVFRYAIPDEQDFVCYYGILNILTERYRLDLIYMCDEVELQGCELSEIYSEMQKYAKDDDEISYEQVRRKALDLKEQGIISQIKGSEGEVRFKLNDPIWDCFELEEIKKIYDSLCFLENVEPFSLPYFLLRKNIELWMKKEECVEFEAYDKEMFLFRHRNPVTVLDSELIYACLLLAKNDTQKDFPCYLNIAPYEINLEKVNRNYLPVTLNVDHLEYDCYTGTVKTTEAAVYVEGIEQGDKKIPVNNLSFYQKVDSEEKKGFTKNTSLHVENIFHSLNSIYFERLIELSFLEDKSTWTQEELIEHFFRGAYWYTDVFERVVRGKKKAPQQKNDKTEKKKSKAKVSYFIENQEAGTFGWIDGGEPKYPIFYTPKLAIEALKNIPQTQFWNWFLEPELRDKIEQATAAYESTWDVSDIEWTNRKENGCSKEERDKFAKGLIENFRECGLVYDRNDKEYYMLRLQYSIYKDEFRILAQETSGEKQLTMLSQGNIAFKPKRANQESLTNARKNYKRNLPKKKMEFTLRNKVKLDWDMLLSTLEVLEERLEKFAERKGKEAQAEEMKATIQEIKSIYDDAKAEHENGTKHLEPMEWDNLLSDGWMSLLSAYEHEIIYKFPNPGEKSGKFEVTLWYWEEDETEILEEFHNFESVFEIYGIEII